MPLNDNGRNACLSGGLQAVVAYIGTATGDPGTAATVSNEATGGSPAYARKAVSHNAPSAGKSTFPTGTTTIDLPAGTYYGVTLHSAVSGGTYYGWLPINGQSKGFGAVDSSGVTSNAIQSAAHGLADGNRVIVYNVFAESLPAGLAEGTFYYVVSATTDTFKVSLTEGGAAVDITGQGELFWQNCVPETYASQGFLSIAAGALTLDQTGI